MPFPAFFDALRIFRQEYSGLFLSLGQNGEDWGQVTLDISADA